MPDGCAYDADYYRERETTRDFRIETRLLLRLLDAGEGARVLEVGCGAGALLKAMRQRGLSVTGVDMNGVALEQARRMLPGVELLAADAAKLPYGDGAFDRVVAHHLIEHLQDAGGALAEWRRVLRPGGKVIICTPNQLYPCQALFADPTHLHVYDPRELRGLLEEAGLRADEVFTVFPHLWKGKISVRLGVPAYRLFHNSRAFKDKGRSLFAAATRT